ncbi:MAG: alpha/beta hydrolase [Desulfamplus sp.]|nr:alpha/beta hydrolase [Desulfamplus sp.]MBF0389243.1 alpha/beta hydrolase [Desulfamplus sp.]
MLSPAPKLQEWLKHFYAGMEVLKQRGFKLTPENAREGLFNLTASLVVDKPDISLVVDVDANGQNSSVPLRVYHPAPNEPLPVLIYYHGGGHMAGSIKIYDPICRKMALATDHIVVAVEYRLTPEFPYPAGVDDSYYVAKNIWSTLEGLSSFHKFKYLETLSLAGDSAGGALAATLSHLAQHDKEIKISKQALIYPSLDYTMSCPSFDENGVGYMLEKEKIEWYFEQYFQDFEGGKDIQSSEKRKSASPLFMEITPNMPDTLVVSAQFCPLRDEGFEYVKRLKQAGIYAENLHFDNMIHAFLNMEILVPDECKRVYEKIGNFLNG